MKLKLITFGIGLAAFWVTMFAVESYSEKPKPKKEYTHNVVFEFQIPDTTFRIPPQCTANQNRESYLGEDSVVIYKHCESCNIGVYSEHENETVRSCSYCGKKEQ